jgi:hypothetical protein
MSENDKQLDENEAASRTAAEAKTAAAKEQKGQTVDAAVETPAESTAPPAPAPKASVLKPDLRGAAAPEDTMVQALLREREGFAQRAASARGDAKADLEDRVAQVDEQLKLRGYESREEAPKGRRAARTETA